MNAEGDSSQQQSHRAALDRYALSRPQLRRADALRNVPMDVSASTMSSSSQSSAATSSARDPADPVSGGITLTGGIPSQPCGFLQAVYNSWKFLKSTQLEIPEMHGYFVNPRAPSRSRKPLRLAYDSLWLASRLKPASRSFYGGGVSYGGLRRIGDLQCESKKLPPP